MTSATVNQEPETGAAQLAEDNVQQYLHDIRQFPRLTPAQEQALARRCAQGDEEAVRAMVNANLRLVVSIAREYAGRGVPMLDLIQEGSIGLLTAAKKFDYTYDLRFSTYATKWIRQGVTRCLMNHGGMIRVPLHTLERMRKVHAARGRLLQQTGQEPTAAQLASECEIPEDKVVQLLRLEPEICSLDAPAGEEEGSLGILLEDDLAAQPQEEMVRRELKQMLDGLLGLLGGRQRAVLRMHYGMEDGVCYSLEQIGKHLGISKERARQIERQAMAKLQQMGTPMGLEDFLE